MAHLTKNTSQFQTASENDGNPFKTTINRFWWRANSLVTYEQQNFPVMKYS